MFIHYKTSLHSVYIICTLYYANFVSFSQINNFYTAHEGYCGIYCPEATAVGLQSLRDNRFHYFLNKVELIIWFISKILHSDIFCTTDKVTRATRLKSLAWPKHFQPCVHWSHIFFYDRICFIKHTKHIPLKNMHLWWLHGWKRRVMRVT